MARRNPHYHVITASEPRPDYADGSRREPELTALCGERGAFLPRLKDARPRHETSCPKCSARVALEMLAGSQLELERDDAARGHHFRSVYRVKLAGVHRAYVVFANGYGGDWRLRRIRLDYDSPELGPKVGGALQSKPSARGTTYDLYLPFYSKEMALAQFPALHEAHSFASHAELIERQREHESRLAAGEERRAREAAEESAALTDIRAGLGELLDKPELSNFQRSAVEGALARLKKP